MAKRIKKVFQSADQVLHLWANQSQDNARCANVFFEGTKCYSYGYHYELGRLVEYKGMTVALINTRGYSVTTSKHISSAFSAASHLVSLGYSEKPAFETVTGYIRQALLEKQDGLINDLFNHFNATKFGYRYQSESLEKQYQSNCFNWGTDWGVEKRVIEFNALCEKLGHREYILDLNNDFIDTFNAHVYMRIKRGAELTSPEAEAKREKQREQREAALIRKAEKQVNDWRNGGQLTDAVRNFKYQLIRVKNDTVETSKGASVPLSHAVRLLSLIQSGKVKDGERIGHFTFNSIVKSAPNTHDGGESVIRIGCHSILLSEALNVLGHLTLKAV